MDIDKFFVTLGVVVLGLAIAFLYLLISRSVLCDDIRISLGKKMLKKDTSKFIKRFLLLKYISNIKKWHYMFFVCDIFLSLVNVILITIIVLYSKDSLFRFISLTSFSYFWGINRLHII